MRRLLLVIAVLGTVIASLGGAAAAAKSGQCHGVVWRSARDGDQVCPRTHSIIADVSWIHLRWSVWGQNSATGTGEEVHYSSGTHIDQREGIKLELNQVKRCPSGARIYSRLVVTAPGHPRDDFVQRYTCRGSGGGGGG